MRLRKYAVGARIAAIVPQYISRRLWLLLAGGDTPKDVLTWLCLDLRDGASLRFLTSEDAPPEEEALSWPPDLADALANWRDWPVLSPDLRRALARMDAPDQRALLNDLEDGGGDIFLYRNAAGEICDVFAWPLPAGHDLEEECASEILPALEAAGRDLVLGAIARAQAREQALPGMRRVKKLRKLREKLEAEEKRLLRMAAAKKAALALRERLWQLPRDFRGPEIKLPGCETPIALDARFDLRENMERLFRQARRGERGLEMLAERKKTVEAELASLETPGAAQPAQESTAAPSPKTARAPRHVQVFTSSAGYTILRGRDAQGNQAVRKLASPHDIWAHVEQGPGAHVIIRRRHAGDIVPEETLLEAGALAANKSWLKDAASAAITYAEARHISPMKNAPQGTVRIARSLGTRQVPVRPELEEKLGG